jgi:carbon-monoxide dehydrogenase large subunit
VTEGRIGDLLTGRARFAGDLLAPGLLHLVFVRSPLAHARIVSIELDDARSQPGVVGVFTAADLATIPLWEIAMVPEERAQPALADGVVRYVGERVVAVVAESLAAAVDAAERVVVEYEPLTVVADIDDAVDVCLAWASDAPDVVPSRAEVAVRVEHDIPRVCTAPMEGHAVLAVAGDDGRLTMHVSTQVPTAARAQIARTLQLDPSTVRVVTPAVGGGFGGKAAGAVGEHMVAGALARALGGPVRFTEARGDNLVGMQGRGVRNSVTLHATGDGRVLGMTAEIAADAGAYANVGAVEPGKTRMMLCGPYRLDSVDVRARAVCTNRSPVGAYRGPGRSEAAVMLERTLDVLAADLGIDPVEIRRRNLIPADAFPYRTPTGLDYDSGDYAALLDRVVELADYDGLRQVQQQRREQGGALVGVGVSLVVDSTAWFSRDEGARVSVGRDGTVVVRTGSAPSGQRHEVVYRQVVQSLLPVAAGDIRVIEGDTDEWDGSAGTMGSRTAQLAGTAVRGAAADVATTLRRRAAARLEADVADIVAHGVVGFGVRGVPASALALADLVADDAEPVDSDCLYQQVGATYPAAAHLSVVEVDPETGRVRPVRHLAVTDCGRVLDPPSAHGQVVGATVQGIAQALFEEAVFGDDGTPRTTSFAEYGIPSAAEVPWIEAHFVETASPHNPLGAKGVGEIGMIGAPVAVQNAVVDALRHLGVRHLDMPCTPAKVWAAMQREGDGPRCN